MLGVEDDEQRRIANIMNCQVGVFPLKYLGIPVAPKKLTIDQLAVVVQKVEKKLENWQSVDLSYGGRKILIDACLDNVPTYLMGFYRLQEGLHVQIDSIRAKFFWEGIGKKKGNTI